MTIEINREINGHNVLCDGRGCRRNLEVEGSIEDFALLSKTVREEKWVACNEHDNRWRHYCERCKNRASNERGSVGVVV